MQKLGMVEQQKNSYITVNHHCGAWYFVKSVSINVRYSLGIKEMKE